MKTDKLAILIIDDSRLIRERLRQLLVELDHVEEVLEAGCYEEALPFLEKEVADVVLLDLGLPGKNGIEVLKDIHRHGWEVSVIVFTNQTDHHYRDLSLSLGAVCFLDKSADFDQLPAIISRLKKKERNVFEDIIL